MPFITEELSSKLADLSKLEKSGYLVENGFNHTKASNQSNEIQLDKIINIISALRVIRAENQNIKNEMLNLIISNDLNSDTQSIIIENELVISGIAKLGKIEFSDKIPAESIEKTMDGYKIIIPLEGLIDPEEEKARLQKELADVENDIKIVNAKLANKQFVDKAPAEVVKKEKSKILDAENKKTMLEKSIAKLQP
jgi:valyl-tRNA synthetase